MKYFVSSLMMLLVMSMTFVSVQAATPTETGLNTAATTSGLVAPAETTVAPLTQTQVVIGNLIQGVLAFIGILFMIMVIYAGIQWMIAGGNSERVQDAKKTLVRAAIGFVAVALAYSLASFIITLLAQQT